MPLLHSPQGIPALQSAFSSFTLGQTLLHLRMQAELAGAEAANSATAGTLLFDTPDVLPPLIQRAKTQLHVLSITEALHEAAAAAHTTADLPRLDSAILAAQKAGLDGLLPEPCRSVS